MNGLCHFLFLLIISFLFPIYVHAEQQITLNEFVVRPSSGYSEWVEFFVPDGVSLSGYWLDDDTNFTSDSGNSKKIALDTLTEGDKNHFFVELSASIFNNSGDEVVLFDPNGTIVDQYKYTAEPSEDGAIGRSPDATGAFALLVSSTKGVPNSNPEPTNTSTPEPTVKPTKQPTVPAQPTVSKSKSTTPTLTQAVPSASLRPTLQSSQSSKTPLSTNRIASTEAYPTAILGIKTEITPQKLPSQPTGTTIVKGASQAPSWAILIGGLGLISCAILVYFRAQIMRVILKR